MVPVNGPVAQMILFCGDKGSTFGSTSSTKYLVAKPRWPTYSFANCMLSGSDLQVPAVRSTRRIFPVHAMMNLLNQLNLATKPRHGAAAASVKSCRRLVAQFVGPMTHAIETGPVGVDVGDGRGRE